MTGHTTTTEKLERFRDELRIAAAGNSPGAADNGSPADGVAALIRAAQQQHQERLKAVGVAPEWGALGKAKDGACGVSLVLDVIALCAEAGIRRLGVAGADLDNRAHALVDLWARAEGGRSLLMELFDQWPHGAPEERVAALKDTLRSVCIDSAARVLEGNFGAPELIVFIEDYVNLQA